MMRPERGFTLLEVLIALLIFSLLAGGIQRTASLYYDHYARIEAKTLATWITQNRLTELRMADSMPEIGENREEITYGESDWVLNTRVIGTEDPRMRRVEMTVSKVDQDSGEARQQLVFQGFLGQ